MNNDQDYLLIQGKPLYFPGWQSIFDIFSDSYNYLEYDGEYIEPIQQLN